MAFTLRSWGCVVFAAAGASVGVLGPGAHGQVAGGPGEVLEYPEGVAVPRGLTEAERRYLERHPIVPNLRAVTPPPTGPVHCVAEYEPMDGILIAWESTAAHQSILTQMARHVTTTGDANVYVVVDTTSERTTASSTLAAGGVDMSRVRFVVRTTDSIWIRDYGPRYIYEGDCRAVVDHKYNRPRPNDDVLPAFFAQQMGHAFYEHPLVHGGGNYHLDATGLSYATRLIKNENPTLTESQIIGYWRDYQNVETHLFDPFRTSVDSTQHLDMWMQVIADDAVVISDFVGGTPAPEDAICDAAAAFMASRGYTVHRVPAMSLSGVHYTFTNVVMCNDVVLVPLYNSNATLSTQSANALAVWQNALPDKTIVQIDCDPLVTFAGVMHCIMMHIPAHRGGLNPTAYLRNLNGGETLEPGEQVEVRWITDDDEEVVNVDILLSTDGGQTWPVVVASATADDGSFLWTVPDVRATAARLRVVARDADGRTGHDDSDADFAINGGCAGDFNGDGALSVADFTDFRLAYLAGDLAADYSGNGTLDVADFTAFRNAYLAGCP